MATPTQQPSPSNVDPRSQEESGGLRRSHAKRFLEGNQLYPRLVSDSSQQSPFLFVQLPDGSAVPE